MKIWEEVKTVGFRDDIEYSRLERAIMDAGEKMGAEVKKGGMGCIEFRLRGNFYSLKIHVNNREPTRYFFVHSGLKYGFATKKRRREFLRYVNEYLSAGD